MSEEEEGEEMKGVERNGHSIKKNKKHILQQHLRHLQHEAILLVVAVVDKVAKEERRLVQQEGSKTRRRRDRQMEGDVEGRLFPARLRGMLRHVFVTVLRGVYLCEIEGCED